MSLTGKTIGQLTLLESPTADTLLPVQYNGDTYRIFLSGITSYGEVTYDELYSLYTGSTLTVGRYYLITDFQTCYDQPDFDQNGNSILTDNTYKTGTTEPLLVLATGVDTLSPKAYSVIYSLDDISYDIEFNQTERTGGPAKGRITERIDNRGNRTDYDFRTVLFKRYDAYYSENYYDGLLSIDGNGVVTGTNTLFSDNFNVGDALGVYEGTFAVPSGCFRYYEILTIDSNSGMTVTGKTINSMSNVRYSKGYYVSERSYYQTNLYSNTGSTEFYTFDASDVFNVKIGNFANVFNWQEYPFILSNNVFIGGSYLNIIIGDESYDNTFDDDMDALTLGNNFYRNIITNDFDRNTVGNYFRNNIIVCDMADNNIGNYFQYNMLGDNDGPDFDQNRIGNYFEGNFFTFANDDFFNNEIGDNFNTNFVNSGFYNNRITGNFYNNNIAGQSFDDNIIGNSFNYNYINQDFYKNQVGVNFQQNNISGQTTNNVIGNQFENNTIYNNFNNNKISDEFKGNMMLQSFESNYIDSFVAGNQFSGSTYNNNIGDFTFDNDFLGYVNGNRWGTGFYGNTIDYDFTFNTIRNNFYNNIIGNGFQYNDIGHNFNNNTIGDNFGYGYSTTQGNRIGNNFFNNDIGEYFYNNSIPDNFHDNEVGDYFQWNVINTNIDTTEFTLNYGNLTGFTYIATGTSAVDNLYIDIEICGTTQTSGVEATFDIEVSSGSVIGVSGNTEGRLYKVDDVLTILGTQIGGTTPEDDVVITVTGVTSGSLFYEHYTKQIFERKLGDKRVSYYDENDVLNIDSLYEASGYIPVYSQSLSFPINYTSFEFWCDGGYTNPGNFTGVQTTNTQDAVNLFNGNSRSFGYFFDNNDGTIGLYVNPSLKQQFCPSGTYTLYVFND